MKNADNSNILILEDDPDQMALLSDFALSELKTLIADDKNTNEEKQKIQAVKIIKTSNINSLKKAVSTHKHILLAILDCNTPDSKGGPSHDQLVKTNHRITGQHKSVDVVTKNLPGTPITMISSLNRFQTIVNKHYQVNHELSINFISKNDQLKIRRNIAYYLRQYLAQ